MTLAARSMRQMADKVWTIQQVDSLETLKRPRLDGLWTRQDFDALDTLEVHWVSPMDFQRVRILPIHQESDEPMFGM